jgi:hypothetical protein
MVYEYIKCESKQIQKELVYGDMKPESQNNEVRANVHCQPAAGWTHSQALQQQASIASQRF